MDDTSFAAPTRAAAPSSLVATPGPVEAVEVGVGYLPAPGHTARLGGDWVDTIARPASRTTAFMIGDVMGHGPHLAGRSQVARTILAAALRDLDPAAALHLLDVNWGAIPAWRDSMATACVLTATPLTTPTPAADAHLRSDDTAWEPDGPVRAWLLRWSSAGHPDPLLLTPDGATSTLPHQQADLPIGVDHTRPRHECTAVVPAGSTLLMFTDGVIEHRCASAVDGLAHLAALTRAVGEGGRRDPATTADQLLAARAPLQDTGDESTLLVAHLDGRPHRPSCTRVDTRLDAA